MLSFLLLLGSLCIVFFFCETKMKLKKVIAVICLIVLSTQVIPLRQIGAMLFNNQITEEIAHTSDCGKKLTGEKELYTYFAAVFNTQLEMLTGTNNQGIYAHSRLIKLHVDEVPTPPPNLV